MRAKRARNLHIWKKKPCPNKFKDGVRAPSGPPLNLRLKPRLSTHPIALRWDFRVESYAVLFRDACLENMGLIDIITVIYVSSACRVFYLRRLWINDDDAAALLSRKICAISEFDHPKLNIPCLRSRFKGIWDLEKKKTDFLTDPTWTIFTCYRKQTQVFFLWPYKWS